MSLDGRHAHRLWAMCVVLLCSSLSVAAHDFWIDPTVFDAKPGSLVGLRLMVGQDLLGDPVPRDPESIERFVVLRGLDETPVVGRDGSDPAGLFRVDRPGLMIVAYRSRPRPLVLPPDKFAQYLGDEGLDAVKHVFMAANRPGAKARELFSRCAKALLSSGVPSAADRDRAVGLRLELIAERNPYTTRVGQDFPVILRYEGKPLAAALVIAQNQHDPTKKLAARSDTDGRVTFRLPTGDAWLIKTVHMIAAPPGSHADWESFWASLTFTIPAGPRAAPAR